MSFLRSLGRCFVLSRETIPIALTLSLPWWKVCGKWKSFGISFPFCFLVFFPQPFQFSPLRSAYPLKHAFERTFDPRLLLLLDTRQDVEGSEISLQHMVASWHHETRCWTKTEEAPTPVGRASHPVLGICHARATSMAATNEHRTSVHHHLTFPLPSFVSLGRPSEMNRKLKIPRREAVISFPAGRLFSWEVA